jgi:hypothetical protein
MRQINKISLYADLQLYKIPVGKQLKYNLYCVRTIMVFSHLYDLKIFFCDLNEHILYKWKYLNNNHKCRQRKLLSVFIWDYFDRDSAIAPKNGKNESNKF